MVLGTADEAGRAWVSPVYGEFERALSECGLKLIHHGVLTALDDLGRLSQQQLADSLDFDKSHLVGHIDHLENHGLVKRGRNPSDRRRNQAVITAAGQALLGELRPVQRSSQQGFLDGLPGRAADPGIALAPRPSGQRLCPPRRRSDRAIPKPRRGRSRAGTVALRRQRAASCLPPSAKEQVRQPPGARVLLGTNGSSRPVLGLDSGDFCSQRRQASRRSSPTLPSSSPSKAAPIPLSDDERVVALDPAVRGEDEEVEPDCERLAVLSDRLPVELDDVAEPLGVVATPEAEPLGADPVLVRARRPTLYLLVSLCVRITRRR